MCVPGLNGAVKTTLLGADKCSATEGLQPSVVDEIEKIIGRIHAEKDCAILLVERNPEFVPAVTRKFAIMGMAESPFKATSMS